MTSKGSGGRFGEGTADLLFTFTLMIVIVVVALLHRIQSLSKYKNVFQYEPKDAQSVTTFDTVNSFKSGTGSRVLSERGWWVE